MKGKTLQFRVKEQEGGLLTQRKKKNAIFISFCKNQKYFYI